MPVPGACRTFEAFAGETPRRPYQSSPQEQLITGLAREHGIEQFTGPFGAVVRRELGARRRRRHHAVPGVDLFAVFNSADDLLDEAFAGPVQPWPSRSMCSTWEPSRDSAAASDGPRAVSGSSRSTRPVTLAASVLHLVEDADSPQAAVAALREQLPAGSLLALSRWTSSDVDEAGAEAHRRLVEHYERTSHPGQLRSRAEIRAFFGDFTLVEPGLVYAPSWRPDGTEEFADAPARSRILAAVARKDA